MPKKDVKNLHYNLDNIVKVNADINIIFGARSDGKSYQLKHKRGVEKYLKTGRRFILLFRLRENITNNLIEQYFQDVDVDKLTNGAYNCITMYRGALYLSVFNVDTNKVEKRGDKIGYVRALSIEQNYAGGSYLDVDDIIFEEFVSRTNYLSNEPDKLMNFYCTVDRKRGTTKLWLAGNSISKVCPYFYEWGIDKVLRQMKQGEIKTFDKMATEDDKVVIAVEYCKNFGKSSHAIGNGANMMNSGAWQTSPQPHLPKSQKEYRKVCEVVFYYKNMMFTGFLLCDNSNYDWFIAPRKKAIDKKILVFSDVIKPDIRWQRDIYNMNIPNKNLARFFRETFRENMIFFSDDVCGTDFKQVIDFIIKR